MPHVTILPPDWQFNDSKTDGVRPPSERRYNTPRSQQPGVQSFNPTLPSFSGIFNAAKKTIYVDTPCPEPRYSHEESMKTKRRSDHVDDMESASRKRKKVLIPDEHCKKTDFLQDNKKTQLEQDPRSGRGLIDADNNLACNRRAFDQGFSIPHESIQDGGRSIRRNYLESRFEKHLSSRPRPSFEKVTSAERQKQGNHASFSKESTTTAAPKGSNHDHGVLKPMAGPGLNIKAPVPPPFAEKAKLDLVKRRLPLSTPSGPKSQRTYFMVSKPQSAQPERKQDTNIADDDTKHSQCANQCKCIDLPPYFRVHPQMSPKQDTFCGTDEDFTKHAKQIIACGHHPKKLKDVCLKALTENALQIAQGIAHEAFLGEGVYFARNSLPNGSALRINLQNKARSTVRPRLIKAEQGRASVDVPSRPTASQVGQIKPPTPAAITNNVRNHQEPAVSSCVIPETPKTPTRQTSFAAAVIDLTETTPTEARAVVALDVPSDKPCAQRVRNQNAPMHVQEHRRSVEDNMRGRTARSDGTQTKQNRSLVASPKVVDNRADDMKKHMDYLRGRMNSTTCGGWAQVPNTRPQNTRLFFSTHNTPAAQPARPHHRPAATNHAAPAHAPNTAAPTAAHSPSTNQGVQPQPQGPAIQKPWREMTVAEKKLIRPPLPAVMPPGGPVSDAQLIAIGKIVQPYERHCSAPYAFHWDGRLRAHYKYLIDYHVENGHPGWDSQEICRIR